MLPIGAASLDDKPILDKYLSEALAENSNPASVNVLTYWLAGIKKEAGKSEPIDPFFLKITCTESLDLIPTYFEMKNGEISIPESSANKCMGYSITNHYDPANYGGHAVTALDRGCTEAIWRSITSKNKIDNLQTSCKTPIKIQQKWADSLIN